MEALVLLATLYTVQVQKKNKRGRQTAFTKWGPLASRSSSDSMWGPDDEAEFFHWLLCSSGLFLLKKSERDVIVGGALALEEPHCLIKEKLGGISRGVFLLLLVVSCLFSPSSVVLSFDEIRKKKHCAVVYIVALKLQFYVLVLLVFRFDLRIHREVHSHHLRFNHDSVVKISTLMFRMTSWRLHRLFPVLKRLCNLYSKEKATPKSLKSIQLCPYLLILTPIPSPKTTQFRFLVVVAASHLVKVWEGLQIWQSQPISIVVCFFWTIDGLDAIFLTQVFSCCSWFDSSLVLFRFVPMQVHQKLASVYVKENNLALLSPMTTFALRIHVSKHPSLWVYHCNYAIVPNHEICMYQNTCL